MSNKTFTDALISAQGWVGQIESVIAVGEGEEPDGTPVIDVWIADTAGINDIPEEVDGHPVRLRQSGGPISAQ